MHGRELGIGHGANGATVGMLGDGAASTDVLAVLSLPVSSCDCNPASGTWPT